MTFITLIVFLRVPSQFMFPVCRFCFIDVIDHVFDRLHSRSRSWLPNQLFVLRYQDCEFIPWLPSGLLLSVFCFIVWVTNVRVSWMLYPSVCAVQSLLLLSR